MFVIDCDYLNPFELRRYDALRLLLNRNERIARGLLCEMMIQHTFYEFIQSLFRTEPGVKLEQTAIVRSFVSLHQETLPLDVTMLKACRCGTEFKGYLDF